MENVSTINRLVQFAAVAMLIAPAAFAQPEPKALPVSEIVADVFVHDSAAALTTSGNGGVIATSDLLSAMMP